MLVVKADLFVRVEFNLTLTAACPTEKSDALKYDSLDISNE